MRNMLHRKRLGLASPSSASLLWRIYPVDSYTSTLIKASLFLLPLVQETRPPPFQHINYTKVAIGYFLPLLLLLLLPHRDDGPALSWQPMSGPSAPGERATAPRGLSQADQAGDQQQRGQCRGRCSCCRGCGQRDEGVD